MDNLKSLLDNIGKIADAIGTSKAAQQAQRTAEILGAQESMMAAIGRGWDATNAIMHNNLERMKAANKEVADAKALNEKARVQLEKGLATGAIGKNEEAALRAQLKKTQDIIAKGWAENNAIILDSLEELGPRAIDRISQSLDFRALDAAKNASSALADLSGNIWDFKGLTEATGEGIASSMDAGRMKIKKLDAQIKDMEGKGTEEIAAGLDVDAEHATGEKRKRAQTSRTNG